MNRDILLAKLRGTCDNVVFNRELCQQIVEYCEQQYDYPNGKLMDVIADREPMSDLKDCNLFYLSDALSQFLKNFKLSDYFDDAEILQYKNTKYSKKKFAFPLIIPCIEIHQGKQWIGAADAKFFLDLNESEMIHYNVNKQRTMQKVIRGEEVIFRTKLVKHSVNQIAQLMQDGEYIPDILTLDIPEDEEDWYYDEDKKEIHINSLDHFDITDGYHRFRAMLKNYELDHSFNYPMGIQITNFSVARTQQFIYQVDQKNKMSAVQSRSYNTNRYSNEIVNMLNEKGCGCVISGMIHRGDNGSSVDYASLSEIIEYYWFKAHKKKAFTKAELMQVFTEVKELINSFMIVDARLLASYWGFAKLAVVFWLIKDKEKTPQESIKILNKLIATNEIKKVKSRTMRKSTLLELSQLEY